LKIQNSSSSTTQQKREAHAESSEAAVAAALADHFEHAPGIPNSKLSALHRVPLIGSFLQTAAAAIPVLVSWPFRLLDLQLDGPVAPAQTAAARAQALWGAIQERLGTSCTGLFVENSWNPVQFASAWSLGQAIGAALDLGRLNGTSEELVASMMRTLSDYAEGIAYTPGILTVTSHDTRYFDDNAWIGLDFMQAFEQTGDPAYLAQARMLFVFLETGLLVGKHHNTGMYWAEALPQMSRNTCSSGPTMELALRLALTTRNLAVEVQDPQLKEALEVQSRHYLRVAEQLYAFINRSLASPSGMYWDNIGDDDRISREIYTYNQGTPIGADVLFYRLTGDKSYLSHAERVAHASLDYFSERGPDGHTRLWTQPPSFNAIFFRNLLALNEVAPDPSYEKSLKEYLDEAWSKARDSQTGFLTSDGIGRYGDKELLDQSGFIQMFALLAKPTHLESVA
jgi:hypothetical protein